MSNKNIIVLSISVFIIACFFSVGFNNYDEHTQILEFAGLKLGLTIEKNLSWEYAAQMRPALQPAIVVLVWKFLNLLGCCNPFLVALIVRIMAATLTFTGIYLLYKRYVITIENPILKNWYLLLSFFLWFAIYNGVRFSSESLSGSSFLIAFALLTNEQNKKNYYYIFVGLLFGLSFVARYQSAFLILGVGAWLLFIKRDFKRIILISIGVIIVTGIGILIDKWFYGKWVLTLWNYYIENIVLDKVSGFGIDPWWYYFEVVFLKAIPPFSLVFILCFLIYFAFKPKDIITFTLLPLILVHFLIGHKEMRFMFPMIGFIPILIIRSIESMKQKWLPHFFENKRIGYMVKIFWIYNIIMLLVVSLKPADTHVSIYQRIYSQYPSPTKLYYCENANPYSRALDVYFYKRKSLSVIKVNTIDSLTFSPEYKQLFVTKKPELLSKSKMKYKLIYSTYPQWIRYFNYNNWIERSNLYYVYELL